MSSRRLSAHELIETVVDPGTFICWDAAPQHEHESADYAADLASAQEKSGADEAVVTGEGRVRGRRVAVAASEFGFLAGSLGAQTSARLIDMFDRATAERLPVLAAPASGGTRMQEGTPAFFTMIGLTAAIRRHKEAGLLYLVYLRHPTTGGTMATWGSLGHMTIAEPGALLGFLGPRVFETLYGTPFPTGVQVSENLREHGLIDAVVPPEELGAVVVRAMDILARPSVGAAEASPGVTTVPSQLRHESEEQHRDRVWDSVLATRESRRPTVRHLLKYGADDVLQLSGTAQGERDPRLFLGLARWAGHPCVVIGQDRAQGSARPMGPALLREARRGLRLAQQLRIPLVTVIDTEGADLSQEAEEAGMASAIARSLSDLLGVKTPVVSVLLGQGTGGGAIALLPADHTIAAEHAWLSPLPPEGASAILYRDTEHASQLAAAQGIDAWSLLEAGIVDEVVPEDVEATKDPRCFARRMSAAVVSALDSLAYTPVDALPAGRARRFGAARKVRLVA
ncbi:carboxyl transferase domain-containing protein [Galactobacter sp.]|uniref:carboxyl transferase domain-containing protein n=1 Tax=Galactobacter sp. TaxID=2676125 RepID=UPI0025C1565B|nr:carboxyl transferase domain-containing protein [Galactobacter sp.]